MAVLSVLRFAARNAAGKPGSLVSLLQPKNNITAILAARNMSEHRLMKIAPSRWSWNKFKDLLNFYFFLGAIPCAALILGVNLFIGPARLVETPEDYVPEHWEYYSHPITRWLAKNTSRSYQQEYEMFLHYVYEEEYKLKLRAAEKRIRDKMAERNDYQGYYFEPSSARYQRFAREETENTFIRASSR